MFFRRRRPEVVTFDDHLQNLRSAGFETEADGSLVKVTRGGYAALIEDNPDHKPRALHVGLAVGNEIGVLVDAGYQKYFQTPTGKRIAAQAEHLKALHDFSEDLKETLGLTSLYNESLGTVCGKHLYDRVEDRDHGVPKRPWQHA
jgi:hypothetical protein